MYKQVVKIQQETYNFTYNSVITNDSGTGEVLAVNLTSKKKKAQMFENILTHFLSFYACKYIIHLYNVD